MSLQGKIEDEIRAMQDAIISKVQELGLMKDTFDRPMLLLSLQRALLGEVHVELRQASIEADTNSKTVRLRFEYDGPPSEQAWESCSCCATEVIADFPEQWQLDEQHLAVPMPAPLQSLAHVAYRRAESQHEA